MNSLTYLTLIITYQCSSRCRHCCIGASPGKKDWMSLEMAEDIISTAVQHGKICWMTLIGGEALQDLDRTVTIGQIALKYGIGKVTIDTNASWAVNQETARSVLERMYQAGLEIGVISMDRFHQEFIPRQRVMNLLSAAKELGLKTACGSVVIQTGSIENPIDAATLEDVRWLEDKGYLVETFPMVFQGRGVQLADLHTEPGTIPTEACKGVPFFAADDWRTPGGLQVDVDGNVMLEHGICIGNTHHQSLDTILNHFTAEDHPIIKVLMKSGPYGLTRIPEAEGFSMSGKGYVDKCHLCQEIRTFLRPAFPQILGPDSYYPPFQEN